MPPNNICDTFFPPVFRSHYKRSKRTPRGHEPCDRHTRRSWTQAEIFISNQLSWGYRPGFIEDRVRIEKNMSEASGVYNYCPCFLEFCLRILGNMRRNKQFAFPSNINIDIKESENFNRTTGGYERSYSYQEKFQDRNLVAQFGTDVEMQRAIESAGALDQETELELQNMREDLHKEAEKEFRSRKKNLLQGGHAETIHSSEHNSRHSGSRTPTGPRKESSPTDGRNSNPRSSGSRPHEPITLETRVDGRSQIRHTDSHVSRKTLSLTPNDSVSQTSRQTSSKRENDISNNLSKLKPASAAGMSNREKSVHSLVPSSRDSRMSSSKTESRHGPPPSYKDGFDLATLGKALVQIAENPSQFRSRSQSRSRDSHHSHGTSRTKGSRRRHLTAETKTRSRSASRYEVRADRRSSPSHLSRSSRYNKTYRGYGKYKSTWRDSETRNKSSTSRQQSQLRKDTRAREGETKQNTSRNTLLAESFTRLRDSSKERYKFRHGSRVASTIMTDSDSTMTDSTVRGPQDKRGH